MFGEDFGHFSTVSAEISEISENVYLSTALKREANSRGCRGTKIEEKSSLKPLWSSFGFWITFCENLDHF